MIADISLQAEELLIGSCLIDPRNLDGIAELVNGSDFSDKDLGELFDLLAAMHSIGKPISDLRVVVSELQSTRAYRPGRVDASRLGRLINSSVATDAKFSAVQVRECSMRRRLLSLVDIVGDAENVAAPVNTIVGRVRDKLDSIDHVNLVDAVTIGEAAAEVVDELNEEKPRVTIFSGIMSLDRIVGGYRPGEMIVLAARPGVGKTSLALQLAQHNAEREKPALFVSLEMSYSELAARMLSQRTGVDSRLIRSNDLGNHEREQLAEAAASLKSLPIVIWSPSTATMQQIRARASIEKRRRGVSLVVIDYLGLVTSGDGRKSRYEQVSETSRLIKQVAKDIGVPILALAQLNREADGEIPRLSNLRDSGSIEQDADIVIFLHQSEAEHKIIVAKHRHGECGEVPIVFDGPATRFDERAKVYTEFM